MAIADRLKVHVERREEWRAWLAEHHASSDGAWLVSWKKATGRPAVGYDAAVEEALCFGWIDSLSRTLDDERSMLLFTPRKTGSRWSRLNKERIDRLTAAGAIEPAGAAVIEAARADILEWILDAKRAATRARRIEETASEAAEGRRANQWPR